MPRATTQKTLENLKSKKHTDETVAIARALLWKIETREIVMERQEIYDNMTDNVDTLVEEFYGEFEGLGVTSRFEKKVSGLSGRKFFVIESDKETIEICGPIGAKSWVLSNKQEKYMELEEERTVSTETISDLTKLLGIA